jgi:hypothetical protein
MKKLAFAVVALVLSASALAHSGGTDAYGCHHDRRTGSYHCH